MLVALIVSAVVVSCKGKKEEKKEEPVKTEEVVTPPATVDTPAKKTDTLDTRPVKPGE
jgi:hypothetical protein